MSNQPVSFGKRNLHLAQSGRAAPASAPTRKSENSPRAMAGLGTQMGLGTHTGLGTNSDTLTGYRPPISYAQLASPDEPLSRAPTSAGAATEVEMMRYVGASWPKYRDMWQDMQGVPGMRVAFSPAAFFFGITWLLYRKQYALAFVLIGAMIAVPFVAPKFTLLSPAINVLLGLFGKSMIVSTAMTKIRQIKSLGLSQEATAMKIEKAGGTTWIAPILISIVSSVLFMIVLGAAGLKIAADHAKAARTPPAATQSQ